MKEYKHPATDPVPGKVYKMNMDSLAKEAFGRTLSESHKEGICINCGLDAAPRIKTEAGRREWRISGMCEVCFDDMFAEED